MATVKQFLQRWESINLVEETGKILTAHSEDMQNFNRQQLLAGLNSRGEFLSPKYSEDPWFKKPGAAERYARWKQRLFPESPYDIPNLIIVGVYHSSIGFSVVGDTAKYEASASFAKAIQSKYNDTALGLNEKSKSDVWKGFLRGSLARRYSEVTGAKLG